MTVSPSTDSNNVIVLLPSPCSQQLSRGSLNEQLNPHGKSMKGAVSQRLEDMSSGRSVTEIDDGASAMTFVSFGSVEV